MKREHAQKWCIDRGITPSGDELNRATSRLEWAKQCGAPDALLHKLRKRVMTLGFALGYGEELDEAQPVQAAPAAALPAKADKAKKVAQEGQGEGEGKL